MDSPRDLEGERQRLFHRLREATKDPRVIGAMERVPRELFVPAASQSLAYEDIPLSIGLGQTISQPYIVAVMTAALQPWETDRVLEVGTGSGYQTAILAELAGWVVTVERHQLLIDMATETLHYLGYSNVEIHRAAATLGWAEGAPYDAILVTAGAPEVPQGLLEQLREGGHLVIPVGSRNDQDLLRVTKGRGMTRTENLGGCRFVPLIGKCAWEE